MGAEGDRERMLGRVIRVPAKNGARVWFGTYETAAMVVAAAAFSMRGHMDC